MKQDDSHSSEDLQVFRQLMNDKKFSMGRNAASLWSRFCRCLNDLVVKKDLKTQASIWLPLVEKARGGDLNPFLDKCNHLGLVPWLLPDAGRVAFTDRSNKHVSVEEISPTQRIEPFFKLRENRYQRVGPSRFEKHFVTTFLHAQLLMPIRWELLKNCLTCNKYFYRIDKRRKFCSKKCFKKSRLGKYNPQRDGVRLKLYGQAKRFSGFGLSVNQIEGKLVARYGEDAVSRYYHPDKWGFLKQKKP